MGLKRLALFSFGLLLSNAAFAKTCDIFASRVDQFFENYKIAGDTEAFQAAQAALLSPHALTSIEDAQGVHVFLGGPEGYFQSLKYWTTKYEAGPDFKSEVVSNTQRQTVVRLHGDIRLRHPIRGVTEVADDQHSWTAIFKFNDDNQISIIDIRMNLFKVDGAEPID